MDTLLRRVEDNSQNAAGDHADFSRQVIDLVAEVRRLRACIVEIDDAVDKARIDITIAMPTAQSAFTPILDAIEACGAR